MQDDRKQFLFNESLAYVFQEPFGSLITNMACGVLLCMLLRSAISLKILAIWLFVLLAVSMARVAIGQSYANHTIHNPQKWYRLYFFGTIVSAFVWGVTSICFFVDDSLQYQFLLVAILAGVVAGAGHSQAPFRSLHRFYTIILMGPVLFRFFLKAQLDYFTFAFALIFLILALYFNSRKMNRVLMGSMGLKYKINEMALTDSLTDLANRRHFDQFLSIEWKRAKRHKTLVSLLMIDVDHFKKFNDFYGHLAGDQCLQRIAKAIRSCISRPDDLVTRYGGEEFAVILPHTDIEGATSVAESIRQTVANLNIQHKGSKNNKIISVSIGIATVTPEMTSSMEKLITASDEALYQAKQDGRDTISIYNK